VKLLRQPGRFAVACGLALAGVKQASLEINLLPIQERGVLNSVKRLVRSPAAREAWGIDIGSSALKAVKLGWNERQRKAVLKDAVLIEHSKILAYASNDAEKRRLVADSLQAFLDCREIKAERICVGLPGRTSLSRQIDLPPVDAAKASKLISFEAPNQFPFPLNQLSWDYQLFNDYSTDTDLNASKPALIGCRALLIAVRQSTTLHFMDAFRRLGVRVDAMQPDFVALHNFLAYDYFAPSDDPQSGPVVAALDIGCEVTNIIVSSPNSLWFRSCGVAGQSFTRALVKEFNLSIAQAEQRKRSPESVECFGDYYEALSPVFDDLLKEVRQSLSAYAEAQPDRSVHRLLGLGGGFSLHGLLRCFRSGR